MPCLGGQHQLAGWWPTWVEQQHLAGAPPCAVPGRLCVPGSRLDPVPGRGWLRLTARAPPSLAPGAAARRLDVRFIECNELNVCCCYLCACLQDKVDGMVQHLASLAGAPRRCSCLADRAHGRQHLLASAVEIPLLMSLRLPTYPPCSCSCPCLQMSG